MTPLGWILALVVAQRLAELVLAQVNTRRLLARGAQEVGAAHYPLFILLHASWLIATAVLVPWQTEPNWWLIGVFAVLQAMRVWVIAALGPYWTTRIITLEGVPLVTGGPFRFVRHPNYCVVIGEIAVLPLAFGAWEIAVIWSVLNAALLTHRIRLENATLNARRRVPSERPDGGRMATGQAPPPR